MSGIGTAVTLRPYRHPADVPGLVRVFNEMGEADDVHERRSVEQLTAWYGHATPHFDPARDIIVAEVQGAIVGYARHQWVDTSDEKREHRAIVFVDPRQREIVDVLLDAGEARAAEAAREQGPVDRPRVLTGWADDRQTWRLDAYARRGYEPIRWGFEMVRPTLDDIAVLPLPDGIEIRPIAGRAALRRLWDADVEAFRDHWGGFDGSDEAFEEWLAEPDHDPSLFVVAFDGDEIAGGVLNEVNASENQLLAVERGWLDSVFTRRPWRRRGLAAGLVARSLVALRDRGLTSAILGVDADNPNGALGVYERAGFVVSTRDVQVRRPWLAPGALPA